MANLRLLTKLLIVIGLMSTIMMGLVWLGIVSLRDYGVLVERANQRYDQALIAERINGLVNGVVMESRGLYAAKTIEEASRFADGIERQLADIDAKFAKWKPLVVPSEREDFEKLRNLGRQFVTLRQDLVRFGRAGLIDEANKVGNNDANRFSRETLNRMLTDVVVRNNALVDENDIILEKFDDERELMMVGLCSGGILIGVLASFAICRRYIAGPVRRLTAGMKDMASGRLDIEVPGTDRRDEVGEMAQAVLVFRDGLADAVRLEAEQKAEQARKEERQKKVEAYITSFDMSVAGSLDVLWTSAEELQDTASSMTRTADVTRSQALNVAQASGEASASVQTVAAASEELASSIQEISRQVQESAGIAERATSEADRTASQVRALAEAAARIGDVVRMINDIASQTNLLALNATIEAARAGDAGKGFAVVASEVKALASQTAKATEEIATQVQAVQGETSQVVTAIEAIGGTITKMNQITAAVAAAVEEQGAATGEIARNVQHAAQGTQQVSDSISEVRVAANDTQGASHQVLTAASNLAAQGTQLRQEVAAFLENIRAA
ncbi:methyl-accepting chemotaxis protein [Lacibacterium aquatile]|uniref:Methyl-accepting chemotaxis protein n=1 Tax=Lacibacterium aquatile TaxID=1168082 RepID=A0ABW5DP72_9PROT